MQLKQSHLEQVTTSFECELIVFEGQKHAISAWICSLLDPFRQQGLLVATWRGRVGIILFVDQMQVQSTARR